MLIKIMFVCVLLIIAASVCVTIIIYDTFGFGTIFILIIINLILVNIYFITDLILSYKKFKRVM
jgi:hypothetical protein